jgi:hypothetical protein
VNTRVRRILKNMSLILAIFVIFSIVVIIIIPIESFAYQDPTFSTHVQFDGKNFIPSTISATNKVFLKNTSESAIEITIKSYHTIGSQAFPQEESITIRPDQVKTIQIPIQITDPVLSQIKFISQSGSLLIIDNQGKNDYNKFLANISSVPEGIKNTSSVPDWVKNNAGWWADGQIDDQTFVNGVKFLIKENIIQVEKSAENSDNQAQNIPSWIKNNAKWWSEDKISEDDFLKGIQFLINNRIVDVSEKPVIETSETKRLEELELAKKRAKERAEQAKKMEVKMFQVYLNNLDNGYTLTDTKNDQLVDLDIIIHDSTHFFTDQKGHLIITYVTQYASDTFGQQYLDLNISDFNNEEDDTYTFQLSGEEKCILHVKQIICIAGKYSFYSSTLSSDESFKFMDIMLKKYYEAQGKEFKQSTKQLSKEATIIPKIEKTYEEKIESLFDVEVIDCRDSPSGNYVDWSGSITSYALEPLDVTIILTGEDINGKIVTFEKEYVYDIYPDQTVFMTGFLDNVPGFDSCGYKIENIR